MLRQLNWIHSVILMMTLSATARAQDLGPTDPQGICDRLMRTMVTRPQFLFDHQVLVHDVAPGIRKRTLPNGLKVFAIKDLFTSKNEVLLGFGKPNVFLVVPDGEGGFLKYAAKSVWRGPSKIEPDTKLIQSGMILRLKNLSPEAIENLRESMRQHEGEKTPTCIRANCAVMEDAGFTDGSGNALTENMFAYFFGRKLFNTGGLMYRGSPVEIEIFKTSNLNMQNYALTVIKAELSAPVRHFKRALGRSETGKGESEPPAMSPDLIVKHPGKQIEVDLTSHNLEMSSPSRIGVLLRLIWGAHALFNVDGGATRPESYFGKPLKEFDQANPSLFTRLKQHFLFSKPVVALIRANLERAKTNFGPQREDTIFNMVDVHSEEHPNMHNVVITDRGITVARLSVRHKFVDWLLTKHVLMTGYSKSVYFAGELWKDADGVMHLNNNSGTYRPTELELRQAIDYLQALFPNTRFAAEPQ